MRYEAEEDEEPIRPLPLAPTPPGSGGPWKHLILPGGVLLVLILALVHDALLADREKIDAPPPLTLIDTNPRLALHPHLGPKPGKPDVMPLPTMRFGLVLRDKIDPTDPTRLKQLTFDDWGRSNNTCLRVDGVEVLFGDPPGVWLDRYVPHPKDPGTGREVDGFDAVWKYDALEVTQRVEIVPGRQSRLLDTCLVQYVLVNKNPNKNAAPMQVGLRFSSTRSSAPWTANRICCRAGRRCATRRLRSTAPWPCRTSLKRWEGTTWASRRRSPGCICASAGGWSRRVVCCSVPGRVRNCRALVNRAQRGELTGLGRAALADARVAKRIQRMARRARSSRKWPRRWKPNRP